jgi:outer membrane lipoprotein-sorting protein
MNQKLQIAASVFAGVILCGGVLELTNPNQMPAPKQIASVAVSSNSLDPGRPSTILNSDLKHQKAEEEETVASNKPIDPPVLTQDQNLASSESFGGAPKNHAAAPDPLGSSTLAQDVPALGTTPAPPKPALAAKPNHRRIKNEAVCPAGASNQNAPLVFPSLSYNDTTHDALINIKASEILGMMDKTYQHLKSYRADFDARSSDDPAKSIVHAIVAFRRSPDRAVALVTDPQYATYLYDGSHIVLYPSPDASHFTEHELQWSNINGAGIGVIFGRLLDDPKHDILSRIMTSGFKTQSELGNLNRLDLLSPIECDRVMCERVEATCDDVTISFLVGRLDHMLRRITWADKDSSGKTKYFIVQYSNVKANPKLPTMEFRFIPPKGVSLVE